MDKRKQFGASQGGSSYGKKFRLVFDTSLNSLILTKIDFIQRSNDDDDDDFGSGFEAELAGMEIQESEAVMGEGPENQQTCQKWSRPEPPKLNPQTDALIFQQIDIENYIGQPLSGTVVVT